MSSYQKFGAMWWADVLQRLGVKTTTSVIWAPVLAVEWAPGKFSLGAAELPDVVAQCLVETEMLDDLEEDLGYSAKRMTVVWPRRFPTIESAAPYANNPEALANKTYGGRMGNTAPGDGWKYRGRGCPMITGKDNYAVVERATGLRVLSDPDLLTTPLGASRALVAWWEKRIPDAIIGDPEKVSKAVNGGEEALAKRVALTRSARTVMEL